MDYHYNQYKGSLDIPSISPKNQLFIMVEGNSHIWVDLPCHSGVFRSLIGNVFLDHGRWRPRPTIDMLPGTTACLGEALGICRDLSQSPVQQKCIPKLRVKRVDDGPRFFFRIFFLDRKFEFFLHSRKLRCYVDRTMCDMKLRNFWTIEAAMRHQESCNNTTKNPKILNHWSQTTLSF